MTSQEKADLLEALEASAWAREGGAATINGHLVTARRMNRLRANRGAKGLRWRCDGVPMTKDDVKAMIGVQSIASPK